MRIERSSGNRTSGWSSSDAAADMKLLLSAALTLGDQAPAVLLPGDHTAIGFRKPRMHVGGEAESAAHARVVLDSFDRRADLLLVAAACLDRDRGEVDGVVGLGHELVRRLFET